VNFAKILKNIELPAKFELLDKSGFEPTEKREKRIPAPQPTTIYKLSMTSMVWNISTGQLGLDAWLCSLPALVHLLIS